jgi:divalent metal cation (Fe/Co/Zn/Cd) transporter
VLAGHAVDVATIGRVRTRRSGKHLFVDIAMGFDGAASIAEVDRRIEAIKSAVRHELADAEISIQASPR